MRILLGCAGHEQAALAAPLGGGGRIVDLVTDLADIGPASERNGPYDAIVVAVADLGAAAVPVLRKLREAGRQVPVLVIAAQPEPAAIAMALNLGADDVVVGPVAGPVLRARVQAMVRRTAAHTLSLLTCGNVTLDRSRRLVTCDGRPVPITTREFDVLETLLLRRNALQSKERFMSRLYGDEEGPDQRIIDVFVCKLRRKLAAAGAAEIVRTVWGFGYVAEDPSPAAISAARARFAAGEPRARRAHLRPAAGFNQDGG